MVRAALASRFSPAASRGRAAAKGGTPAPKLREKGAKPQASKTRCLPPRLCFGAAARWPRQQRVLLRSGWTMLGTHHALARVMQRVHLCVCVWLCVCTCAQVGTLFCQLKCPKQAASSTAASLSRRPSSTPAAGLKYARKAYSGRLAEPRLLALALLLRSCPLPEATDA